MDTKSQLDRLRAKLAKIAEKYGVALAEFERVVANPKSTFAALEESDGRVKKLSAERTRIMEEFRLAQFEAPERFGAYRSRSGQRPLREQALDLVDELGVPVSPRVVSDYAAAVLNAALPPARFASLRRDEERAYQRDPHSRPAWVVPAINVAGLSAMPRLVASSVWEPERRLIASRTLRVNHLKVLLALIRKVSTLGAVVDPRPVTAMVHRFSSLLPTRTNADLESVRVAAQSELDAIAPDDESERTNAAIALRKLPVQFQLWGRPTLLEGGNSAIGRALG